MPDTEQPAFTDRYQQSGEAVYHDLAFDLRIFRIREVDYEERVDCLVGYDISPVSEVADRLDALVAGKACDAAGFFEV